tara:strand:+ start:969 stop:1418 length:450 start_codon:yes stop_codon:yes gene_type:complete
MAINFVKKNAVQYKGTMKPLFNQGFYEFKYIKDAAPKLIEGKTDTVMGKYKFLGYIKKLKHFTTIYNEIYVKKIDSYHYDDTNQKWCDKNKIIYTYQHPQQYKLLTIKDKKYFYDVNNKDTYRYDPVKEIVVYAGIYNENLNKVILKSK